MKRLTADNGLAIDPLAVATEDMVRTVYARIKLLDPVSLDWLCARMKEHEVESHENRPQGFVGPTAAVRYFAAVRALAELHQKVPMPAPSVTVAQLERLRRIALGCPGGDTATVMLCDVALGRASDTMMLPAEALAICTRLVRFLEEPAATPASWDGGRMVCEEEHGGDL